jgi:MFS family permease
MADVETPSDEKWLNRTVVGAGVTSALGDLTYESSHVILPGFLAVLGIPPFVLGTIEGIADGVASFTKLASGYFADRLGFRKALVVVGYSLTALQQVFLALAVGWWMILIGRAISWFGKGIRGPLRNAIIAEAVGSEARGKAFGFHRAADTLGAVLGPLLGVALLAWAQTLPFADASGAFRVVFWLALIPGVLSVISFAVLVKDNRTRPNPRMQFGKTLRNLPRPFRRYLLAVGLYGMGDFSALLLILGATQILTPSHGIIEAAQIAGLLYVGRNLVQVIASVPIGALADRFGHKPVLIAGYVCGCATVGLLIVAFANGIDSLYFLGVIFFLAGLCIAVQEALEAAITADLVPEEVRGTSYGVLGAVNGVGDMFSSIAVGILWTTVSPAAAFALSLAFLLAGTVAMKRVGKAQADQEAPASPTLDD